MTRTPIGGSARMPFEGRMFGGYRIAHPIATGGMATVFLARKTGPGRYAQTAAIKIIHPHLARNRELAEMFMDEARLASSINHPCVCRVLDFGEAEGTFFLAMEYVRGESWATVLPALRASAPTRAITLSAYVLSQACEGLHAIHEAHGPDGRPLNIVHRDVSPQNLLIGYDGSVRLLDFGIASAEGRAHTGSTEVVRGRYAYMAPEQMRGLDVDRRADVWSLGVMLFEALSGHNPFIRDTQIASMLAVTQEPLPAWPAPIPPELLRVAQHSLARPPDQRFGSARELGDALRRTLTRAGEPALGAELSRQLHQLFAERVAQKRAALRELSGEDTSVEMLSSAYPALQATATPQKPLATVTGGQLLTRRPTRGAIAAGFSLFALSSAVSWYLVHRDQSAESAAEASRPPDPSVASATPTAPTPRAAAPAPAGGAAAAGGSSRPSAQPPATSPQPEASADDTSERRERRQRRRREHALAEEPLAVAEPPAESEPRIRVETRARSGPGTVLVGTSQGWALVYEGTKKLGTTPLKLELSSGAHTLIVRPYGEGSPRRVAVDVRPGEMTKLRLDL